MLQEFEYNSPGGFVHSADGRFLYGSAYSTGASNLFRVDLSSRKLEALTNSETGLFRPLPLPDGSLAAFEYTARGFLAVTLPVKVLEDVNAIPYLGQSAVEKYPELKTWKLPSRSEINDLDLRTYAGEYKPFRNMRLVSMYPIVQGYEGAGAGGMRFDFADGLALSRMSATASFSPDTSLPLKDRFHATLEGTYWDWSLAGYFNRADFYDLFGPTRVSRRGGDGAELKVDITGPNSPVNLFPADSAFGGFQAGIAGGVAIPEMPTAALSAAGLLLFGLFASQRRFLGAIT